MVLNNVSPAYLSNLMFCICHHKSSIIHTNQMCLISWMALYFFLPHVLHKMFFLHWHSYFCSWFIHLANFCSLWREHIFSPTLFDALRWRLCTLPCSCITCETWLSKHFITPHFNWMFLYTICFIKEGTVFVIFIIFSPVNSE